MNKRDLLIKYYEIFNEDNVVDYREYLAYVNNYEEYFFDLILVFYLGKIPFYYLDNYFRQGITYIKMHEAHEYFLNKFLNKTIYLKIVNQLEIDLNNNSKKL